MVNDPQKKTTGGGLGGGLFAFLLCASLAAAVLLHAANLLLGDLNQDEGWYLYAAGLVHGGQKPMVDFATTQGPMMPYVYALGQPLVDRWGVAGGRLFTAALGMGASLLTAWLAWRLAPPTRRRTAALVAFALIGLNVYQSYFFTIVKTYSLTGLLLVAGFCLLTVRMRVATVLAGVLMSAAAATRLSAGVALPVVGLCLLVCRRRIGWEQWLWFGLGGAAGLTGILGPFAMKAPDAFKFAMFEYHAARDAGSVATQLAYKAGFVSRTVQAYFPAVVVMVATGGLMLAGRRVAQKAGEGAARFVFHPAEGPGLTLLTFMALTLVHMAAAFPYDDYQVIAYPLLAAGVAVWLVRSVRSADHDAALGVCVWLLCLAGGLSSPVNERWFVGERDRIWWPLKQESALKTLRGAAEQVRAMTKPGEQVLTQDLYLAVEAGRPVPKGMELGPFCYFPEWSDARARACHVLNRRMMHELIAGSEAPVAAFSGYGLAMECPAVRALAAPEQASLWRAVETRYEPFAPVERFGQAGTTLTLWRRKR